MYYTDYTFIEFSLYNFAMTNKNDIFLLTDFSEDFGHLNIFCCLNSLTLSNPFHRMSLSTVNL